MNFMLQSVSDWIGLQYLASYELCISFQRSGHPWPLVLYNNKRMLRVVLHCNGCCAVGMLHVHYKQKEKKRHCTHFCYGRLGGRGL
jgi:hypothetical protein